MVMRTLLSLFFFVSFSTLCNGMAIKDNDDLPSFCPVFKGALETLTQNVEKGGGSEGEREMYRRRRLSSLYSVYQRDEADSLSRKEPFRRAVTQLLNLEATKFRIVNVCLQRQEEFLPLDSIQEFLALLTLVENTYDWIERTPTQKPPYLRVYNASSIDSLVRTLTLARLNTPAENYMGFICDIFGILTNESALCRGTHTPRTGMQIVLSWLLQVKNRIHIVGTGRESRHSLSCLHNINYGGYFRIQDDTRSFDSSVSSDDEFATNKNGHIEFARKAISNNPSSNGHALSTCYPLTKFSTVLIADINPNRLVASLESLMRSKAGDAAELIYLVLVQPASTPSKDRLTRETITDFVNTLRDAR